MKVAILCGGLGTRLAEETIVRPKPMVEVGGYPILWHIMNIYASQGYNEFVLALGYKGEIIKDYFLNYYCRTRDVVANLGTGEIIVKPGAGEKWIVHMLDTGQTSQTGGRVIQLCEYIKEPFMMTYGDGVGDIDLHRLESFHKEAGKIATVTAVRPPARFGGLDMKNGLVAAFSEKPSFGEGWINGGYFVIEPEISKYIDGQETILERGPMEHLARVCELAACTHEGFWHCMDTLRDVQVLNELWNGGNAPWKTW